MPQKKARKATTTKRRVAPARKPATHKRKTTHKKSLLQRIRGSISKKGLGLTVGILVIIGLGVGGYALWQNLNASASGRVVAPSRVGTTLGHPAYDPTAGQPKIWTKLANDSRMISDDGRTFKITATTYACKAPGDAVAKGKPAQYKLASYFVITSSNQTSFKVRATVYGGIGTSTVIAYGESVLATVGQKSTTAYTAGTVKAADFAFVGITSESYPGPHISSNWAYPNKLVSQLVNCY